MRPVFEAAPGWPCLAWLASFTAGDGTIHVRHGTRVETRASWFCEAVWDGDFEEGRFDHTDVVFGSGCRFRDGQAVFVSAGSVSDRLHWFRSEAGWHVSNSLACLVAALDLRIDPWYPHYYKDLFSITAGIDEYKPELATASGRIHLSYYHNLAWDGRDLRTVAKPFPRRGFASFSAYREFLLESLRRLAGNMRSAGRTLAYEPVSAASSGYDSLAVSILSGSIGNRRAICFETDRLGRADSGAGVLQGLGFDCLTLARDAWRSRALAEVPFISADACGRDAFLSAAREVLDGRVLFSGHHGGSIWRMDERDGDGVLSQADNAGLSLAEFRLQAGFVHCPLAVIGARQRREIRGISRSQEMRAWSVGGHYDKPIPRRIIEEADVERGAFARIKSATSVHLFTRREFDRFMPGSASFRDYMSWLRQQARDVPPAPEYPSSGHARDGIQVPLFRHLFPWALDRMRGAYPKGGD